MTLLDTIPIYIIPWWFTVIMIITGATLLTTIIMGTSDKAGAIAGICLLILAVGIILGICGIPKIYDHDEYIVILDKEASATEFFKNYEITKVFDYSDAWQVKKKR